jgi:hypothetical protein
VVKPTYLSIDISTNKYVIQKPEIKYNIHVLKSAIQKATRRRMVHETILLCYQLMSQNFNKFIRRISMIMIEDSIVHKQLPFIIWCMVAITKNFIPTKYDIYIYYCKLYLIYHQ